MNYETKLKAIAFQHQMYVCENRTHHVREEKLCTAVEHVARTSIGCLILEQNVTSQKSNTRRVKRS